MATMMQPLQRAEVSSISEALIRDTLAAYSYMTREAVVEMLTREAAKSEYWINDLYQVAVTHEPPYIHLNIRRRDGKPIFRDWRHFQAIKNQIVGEECEAVELYPAESRKVDTSNKYHLYAVPTPDYRFNFGYNRRDVVNDPGSTPGTRQRVGA